MFLQSFLSKQADRFSHQFDPAGESAAITKHLDGILSDALEAVLNNCPENLRNDFVLVALGSYGRQEITYDSDIDVGMLIAPSSANAAKTLESLAGELCDTFHSRHGLGLPLELAEAATFSDKFADENDTYTLFTWLEGRALAGNAGLLTVPAKTAVAGSSVWEQSIRYVTDSLSRFKPFDPERYDLKNCAGGMRHIENVLRLSYLTGVTAGRHNAAGEAVPGFSVIPAIALWKDLGIVSENEAGILCKGINIYRDLRNFCGLSRQLSETDFGRDGAAAGQELNVPVSAYVALRPQFQSSLLFHALLENYTDTVRSILQRVAAVILAKPLALKRGKTLFSVSPGDNSVSLPKHWQAPGEIQESAGIVNFLTVCAENRWIPNESALVRITDQLSRWEQNPAFTLSLLHGHIMPLVSAPGFGRLLETLHNQRYTPPGSLRIKTAADFFFPPLNTALHLSVDSEWHEFTLDVHLIKTLQTIEEKMTGISVQHPEFTEYLTKEDMFELKWAALLHDIGKTLPQGRHEKTGAELSEKLLRDYGFSTAGKISRKISYLINYHQRPEEIMRLSVIQEEAFGEFIQLCEGNIKNMLHLFILCYSDAASVHSAAKPKAAAIETFFYNCLNLMMTGAGQPGEAESVRDAVMATEIEKNKKRANTFYLNFYFTAAKTGIPAMIKHWQETNLIPADGGPDVSVLQSRMEAHLKNDAHIGVSPGERYKIVQQFRSVFDEETARICFPESYRTFAFFFNAFPNRMLIDTPSDELFHLIEGVDIRLTDTLWYRFLPKRTDGTMRFVFFAGGGIHRLNNILSVLGKTGMNIEGGKINLVTFYNQTASFCGYMDMAGDVGAFDRYMFSNLLADQETDTGAQYPDLREVWAERTENKFYSYTAVEPDKGEFKRSGDRATLIKISTEDKPMALLAMLNVFLNAGCHPQQITLTAYGKRTENYFYFPEHTLRRLDGVDLNQLFQRSLKTGF